MAPLQDPGIAGKAYETAVFRHLREVARSLGAELSYFRRDDDLEIDFVLEHGGLVTGIEVTSSLRVRPDKVRRVQQAGAALGASRLLLIHGGALEETAGEVRAIALRQFLLDPAAYFTEGV